MGKPVPRCQFAATRNCIGTPVYIELNDLRSKPHLFPHAKNRALLNSLSGIQTECRHKPATCYLRASSKGLCANVDQVDPATQPQPADVREVIEPKVIPKASRKPTTDLR